MSGSELAEVETLLVKVLADPMGFAERILGELAERLATPTTGATQVVVNEADSAAHAALADRNVLLAAALGACECWGEDPACSACFGAGHGWVPPDPALYDECVKPAVLRASTDAYQPGRTTTDDERTDTDYAEEAPDEGEGR
jgi:hypothetical protein